MTFGDPDFLNGPGHALRVARAVKDRCPDLTFDFTAKVEHLVGHPGPVAELGRLGALFVTTAVESLSDRVLARLAKGHRRADVEAAFAVASSAGIAVRPTLVPFTPWETLDGYLDLLDTFAARGWLPDVDPVQLTLRLLIPPGSLLEGATDVQLEGLDERALTWRWRHPDPRMDALQREVAAAAAEGERRGEPPQETQARIAGARGPGRRARAGPNRADATQRAQGPAPHRTLVLLSGASGAADRSGLRRRRRRFPFTALGGRTDGDQLGPRPALMIRHILPLRFPRQKRLIRGRLRPGRRRRAHARWWFAPRLRLTVAFARLRRQAGAGGREGGRAAPREYRSIQPSPKLCRAARSLCKAHAIRMLPTVDLPPRATGTMWSYCRRWVEPQTPPSEVGQTHLPPSRSQTCRLTSAGM